MIRIVIESFKPVIRDWCTQNHKLLNGLKAKRFFLGQPYLNEGWHWPNWSFIHSIETIVFIVNYEWTRILKRHNREKSVRFQDNL